MFKLTVFDFILLHTGKLPVKQTKPVVLYNVPYFLLVLSTLHHLTKIILKKSLEILLFKKMNIKKYSQTVVDSGKIL